MTWYPFKFHGPITLNDIKPPFSPIFSQCLSSNMAKLRLRMAQLRRLSPGWSCPMTTGSKWPTPCGRPSGAEWFHLGIFETKTSEHHGRKPWEIYGDFWEIFGKSMFFFKGKSNFREIYVFFLRKPHFFSKSIFFRHGEVKKALLFLEGKHKRGSMMKSFIRFFSFGMWISGYHQLPMDTHWLLSPTSFFSTVQSTEKYLFLFDHQSGYPLVNKHSDWKWPFSTWIFPLEMAIFHSYVSLPEGKL